MKLKKLLCLVLSLAMILGTMSTVAFAGDTTVAKIGEQEFSSLQAAYNSAVDGDVIDLVADTTEADWQYGIKGITLNGNGNKVIVSSINQNTIDNGQMLFRSESETMPINISDVTFELCDNTMVAYVVTGTISNVTIKGGKYGINVSGAAKIENCTFEGQSGEAIYFKDEVGAPGAVVDGCTFNLKTKRVCALWSNEIFTNNTINYEGEAITGLTILANSSATVTGNTMPEDTKLEIYILDDSQGSFTLSDNNIAGSVFTDGAEISNQFENVTISDNVLSSSALEGLKKVDSSVANVVAIIGEVKYSSLAEAAQAAQTGDIIEIVSDVEVAEGETITLNGVNLESADGVTLSNKGTIEIGGECSLNLALYSGEDITFLDGAIINNSTVGGPVFVAGNVTFRGDNTFAMIYDFGTLQDYYGTTADMKWTVEEGASVTLTDTARYGLGYGDNVTINGNLAAGEALTTRDTLTDDDKSLVMHGLVAQESKGWNCNSALTINNAYVQIGSNNSFGNKPGNYGGNYTININNSVVDASRITFYEALSTTTFNITGSDVEMGQFMIRDKDSVFTLTDSKVESTSTINGGDEGQYIAGNLNLVNTDLTYAADLTIEEGGVLTIDTDSMLKAPAIKGTGTIAIDISNYNGYGEINVIDANLKGFTGNVTVVSGSGVTAEIVDGKIVATVSPVGGPIIGYVDATRIWGETRANAKESYVVKVYSDDTFMGQSSLNNVENIIDGDVSVTWNVNLAGADSEYWNVDWTIAPSMDCQPTHVALVVDGVEVSRTAINYNAPDDLNKIYAAITDADGKILRYATTLQDAVDNVAGGQTIEILRDVALTTSLVFDKEGTIVMDGNGYTISQTSNYTDTQNAHIMLGNSHYGAAEAESRIYTIKNVVFDGLEGWSVIRSQGVTLNYDNNIIQNCNLADGSNNGAGALRVEFTKANITNSKWNNNTAVMGLAHNWNGGDTACALKVDECVFEGNTFNGTAAIYYVKGAGCEITNTEFINNDINCNGNGATIYLGFQEDCTVKNCFFKGNDVVSSTDSKRVAGGIFFGYEAEITNNVFEGNTATNSINSEGLGQHVCTSTNYDCTIDLDNNYFDGEEPAEGVHYFIQHKTGDGTFNLENYYGSYSFDDNGNVVLSDAKHVVAKDLAVQYVENAELSNADEGLKVYDIVIVAKDEHLINRLNTADLTFALSSDKVAYEIIASNEDVAINPVNPVAGKTNRYEFHFNGKDNVEDTDLAITIGQVRLTGFDAFTFEVAQSDYNLVTATTIDDNIVTEFTVGNGLVVNEDIDGDGDYLGKINTEIAVPTRNLTINITFPNAVEDNDAAAYQDMTVTIVGGTYEETFALGENGVEMVDGAYVISKDLAYNTTYTVTVEGAGYRTARYSVVLTDHKVLNFWNNAMDEAQFVEIGKDSSKVRVTFLAGDIVKDNNINIYDLSAVVSYFGTENLVEDHPEYAKYDLNRDGVIDSKDVAYVLVSWNE